MTAATPAEQVALAADRMLNDSATDTERLLAGLLNYVAATWDHQDQPLREHALAVARAVLAGGAG